MKSKSFPFHSLFFTKSISIPSIFSLSFPFSSPRRCFPFSTTSSFAPNPPKLSHSFDDVVSVSSAVYRHALKFQRPAVIRWQPQLENTASFIGSVTRELMRVNTKTGTFGVHTVLLVRKSNQPSSSSFRVLLMMWGRVAKLASEHLKPNDFIYASGCLGSYTKADSNGNLQLNYKLIVKEFEFVTQRVGYQGHGKLESVEEKNKFYCSEKRGSQKSGYQEAEAGIQNDHNNRLYLWQVFFTNPNEWWDQRKRKLNPNQPDFKHKDTGEALWLSKYDPPWVKRQLQLLDSKMAAGLVRHRSRVTNWVYDE